MSQATRTPPTVGAAEHTETTRLRRRGRLGREQALLGPVFIAPAMILFFLFVLLPAGAALVLSFHAYDILNPAEWVGLANYRRLLDDTIFHRALRNIVAYCVLYVPTTIAIALAVALALNRRAPGVRLFRMIYYMPVVTSLVAASTVWTWLLHKDFGPINQLLGYVGIDGPAWLSDSDTALLAIVLVTVWQGIGGNMVVYLAGLKGVPTYLYEAARLDGAGPWQTFRDITWPSLRTTTLFVVTMTLIGSFQLFDQAYVMTQGGPGYATTTPVYAIYQSGFNRLQMGYASAQAFVLFLVILAVTVINLRANREHVAV
ncbi:MAG: carbohydrate ABC transporter permease [Thermomicrobiales bacterium]